MCIHLLLLTSTTGHQTLVAPSLSLTLTRPSCHSHTVDSSRAKTATVRPAEASSARMKTSDGANGLCRNESDVCASFTHTRIHR